MSNAYYAEHGHVALDCWTCDLPRCKCDRAQMRAVKRGARQRWRRAIDEDAAEPELRDLAEPWGMLGCCYCAPPGYDGCREGEIADWMTWLRAQAAYPTPPLTRPLMAAA